MAEFSGLLWDPMISMLVSEVLSKRLPTSAAQLPAYKAKLGKRVASFEENMREIGLAPESSNVLSLYVANLEIHFWKHRRKVILTYARALMLDQDFRLWTPDFQGPWQIPVPSASSPSASAVKRAAKISARLLELQERASLKFFANYPCQVTVNSVKLVHLFYSTLEEACESTSSSECALRLFLCAKDIFFCFVAVFESHHSAALNDTPHLAMLYYNDATMLAHHALECAPIFRNRLVRAVGNPIVLSDLAFMVQKSGEKFFINQLKHQQSTVISFLDDLDHFTMIERDAVQEKLRKCIQKVVLNFAHLLNAWNKTIPDRAVYRILGALMNLVVGRLTSDLLERVTGRTERSRDISMTAGERIHELFYSLIECAELQGHMPYIIRYTRNWERFCELAEVIHPEQSLRNLRSMIQDSKLQLLQSNELVALVKAIYEETPNRTDLIEVFESRDTAK
eukprot:533013_1